MKSKLLTQYNVPHFIAGMAYNFRDATLGADVREEFERMLAEWGEVPNQVYSARQVHGQAIAICDGTNGQDYYYGKYFPNTDGLITNQSGVGLVVKFADCTPIVLYDPTHHVLATIHSGWRSTVQSIIFKTIRAMQREFDSDPAELIGYIGPTISQDDYQVGPEIYDAFKLFERRDEFFREEGDHFYLDVGHANECLMIEAGMQVTNIEMCPEKTYHSELLHSARREQPDYELNAMIAMLPNVRS